MQRCDRRSDGGVSAPVAAAGAIFHSFSAVQQCFKRNNKPYNNRTKPRHRSKVAKYCGTESISPRKPLTGFVTQQCCSDEPSKTEPSSHVLIETSQDPKIDGRQVAILPSNLHLINHQTHLTSNSQERIHQQCPQAIKNPT